MSALLVVHHAPTDQVEALRDAVLDGAREASAALVEAGAPEVEVVARPALEASADEVLSAGGVVLVTTCNFGYMSGALKHFFDRTFRDLEGRTSGLPWALVAKGTTDVTGVRRSVAPIVTGLGWREAAAAVELEGDVTAADLDAAGEVGRTMAGVVGLA